MTEGSRREEVLNVILAQLLHELGLVTAPEQILRSAVRGRRRMPDVMVTFQGLRTAIEGKVGDQSGAEAEALADATSRVEQGIAHIGVAVVYHASLRKGPFGNLAERMRRTQLRMAVYSETGGVGWIEGDVDHLAVVLRRTYEQLVQEDVVAAAAQTLDEAVGEFAAALRATPASVERLGEVLGIGEAADNNDDE